MATPFERLRLKLSRDENFPPSKAPDQTFRAERGNFKAQTAKTGKVPLASIDPNVVADDAANGASKGMARGVATDAAEIGGIPPPDDVRTRRAQRGDGGEAEGPPIAPGGGGPSAPPGAHATDALRTSALKSRSGRKAVPEVVEGRFSGDVFRLSYEEAEGAPLRSPVTLAGARSDATQATPPYVHRSRQGKEIVPNEDMGQRPECDGDNSRISPRDAPTDEEGWQLASEGWRVTSSSNPPAVSISTTPQSNMLNQQQEGGGGNVRPPQSGPPIDEEGWQIAPSSMTGSAIARPSQEEATEEKEEIMVTATLVAPQDTEQGEGRGLEEPELVAVAEKVSYRYCFIWGRNVHWGYIAGMIVFFIAAVTAAVTITATRRRAPSNQLLDPEELGTCGGGKRRNGTCANGTKDALNGPCCSRWGWCGISPEHCVNMSRLDPDLEYNFTATVGPISTDKICGGYYPDWSGNPRVRNIHPNYNLVYLFTAKQSGAKDGSILFSPPYDSEEFRTDVQQERSMRNRTFILTAGGVGLSFSIPDRTFSQTFVDGVKAIYRQIGGFDGLDWSITADGIAPSTEEMIWIGLELKRLYPGFILSFAAVPYRHLDKEFCREAVLAGALDYCAPIFYGIRGVSVPASILAYAREWVDLVGEEHIIVGLGVHHEVDFQTPSQAVEAYNETKALFPDIRGVYNWEISYDHEYDTRFAEQVCTV